MGLDVGAQGMVCSSYALRNLRDSSLVLRVGRLAWGDWIGGAAAPPSPRLVPPPPFIPSSPPKTPRQNRDAMWGRSVVSNCYADGGCITTRSAAAARLQAFERAEANKDCRAFSGVLSEPRDERVAAWLKKGGIRCAATWRTEVVRRGG